jgi:hypothetical protein
VIVVTDPPQKQRFREQVRYLLVQKLAGDTSTQVNRREIEDIGASLSMRSDEACQEFLALYDTLWTVRTGSIEASRIISDESRANSPPRNWLAFNGVVLL